MIATFKNPEVFAANLKAASLAMSEDPTRAHLCTVRIEFRPGVARFIATNGHWLWVNETHVETDGTAEILVARDDLKRILKLVETGKKASTWAVEVDTLGKVSQMSQSLTFVPVVATFPPYEHVIPGNVGGDRIIATFDAAYMAKVSAAFVLVGASKNGSTSVSMHTIPDAIHRKGEDPIPEPIVFTSAAAPDALAVLMPMRAPGCHVTSLTNRYRRVAKDEKAA